MKKFFDEDQEREPSEPTEAPDRDIHAILADIEAEFLHFPDAATAKARALLVELRRAL